MKTFTATHAPQLHLPPGLRLEALAPRADGCPTHLVRAPILRNEQIAPEHFLMRLQAKEVAAGAPGQFVMIRPVAAAALHPLLPRPMAVYRYYPERGEFEIVYRVIGEGTRRLSERRVGECTELVGPVGRPFVLDPQTRAILLVGRGIGICSLTSLVNVADQRGIRVFGLLSARSPEVLIGANLLAEHGADARCVTDAEGTSDPEQVRPWLEDLMRLGLVAQAFVCGANRLLALATVIAAEYGVEVQVSLEAHMACGIGYCHGCATGAFGQVEESPLVCRDGPVFRCRANGSGHG